MIVGVGGDLVEIARIRRAIERYGSRFLDRIFTPEERRWCQATADAAACYAKRFAAKEALAKAMGTGLREGLWFTDMAVGRTALGQPTLETQGKVKAHLRQLAGKGFRLHLSLSDDGGLAQAWVVVERRGGRRKSPPGGACKRNLRETPSGI
ncbi:MAG: holo-ACP synthase [Magnetococcales bacterium]|nr:holo-ACP synthase [Magnetococcales bacterium]